MSTPSELKCSRENIVMNVHPYFDSRTGIFQCRKFEIVWRSDKQTVVCLATVWLVTRRILELLAS